MDKITANDFVKMKPATDKNGRYIMPTGDYSEIRHFGMNYAFPAYCKFAKNTSFGDNCTFGDCCVFENDCTFGRDSVFGNSSFFGVRCRFEKDCIFGSLNSFGNKCEFRKRTTFGSENIFGIICEFGNSCTFGIMNTFGLGCKFDTKCSFGKNCYFADRCRFKFPESFDEIETPVDQMLKVDGLIYHDPVYFFRSNDIIYIRCMERTEPLDTFVHIFDFPLKMEAQRNLNGAIALAKIVFGCGCDGNQ